MVGGFPGNSFVLMEFQDVGGVAEVTALLVAAVVLDGAELVERLLELTGEAGAVESEGGDGLDGGLRREIGRCGLVEQAGFEERDAVEAPGGVGELLDELGFGGVGGLVFVSELAAVLFVGGRVFGGEDGGAGRESVSESVERRTLLAGFGSRAGGMLRILAIDGSAVDGDALGLSRCSGVIEMSPGIGIARACGGCGGRFVEVVDGTRRLGREGA